MEILFPLAIVVVIVLFKLAKSGSKRTSAAWSAAAERLGIDFVPASLMKPKTMSGRFQGNQVEVRTHTQNHGKSSTTWTRYRVQHAKPLGLGIRLSREGFFSGVASFLGAQNIKVGDEAFDSNVVVKGVDPARVQRYLTPERRRVVLRLQSDYPGIRIDDHGVEWSAKGTARETEKIVATVQQLSSAVTRLGHDVGAPVGAAAIAAAATAAAGATSAGQAATAGLRAAKPDADFADTGWVAEIPLAAAIPEGFIDAGDPRVDAPAAAVADAGMGSADAAMPAAPADAGMAAAPADTVTATAPADGVTTAAPAEDPLAVERVCAQLIAPTIMSTEARQRFEQQFKDQRVRWTGSLRRAASYRIDIVFRDGAGTKATFALPVQGDGAFGRTVQAIVQLPPEAAAELGKRIGQDIAFEGRLAGFDPLIRQFHVARAKLIETTG